MNATWATHRPHGRAPLDERAGDHDDHTRRRGDAAAVEPAGYDGSPTPPPVTAA
ncbi:hypothetical protein WB401_03695 [Streptomyces brasiliscabiei]|uniref:Uncharacterized protein n=1 Tax=Streptomyces brasiliscabiei TaxID=2736302 RepID=A0ABU8GGG8_9ACTN